jgi:hypothetical protein
MNGLTIENDVAWFWNFNRGHICCSLPFDYHKVISRRQNRKGQTGTDVTQSPDLLIAYYLNQSYGTPEQLGYDPTVEAETCADNVTEDSKVNWIFTVGGQKYKTIGKPISERSNQSLRSETVTVWTVRDITRPHAKPQVLKDFYPWSRKRPESAIQADIFHRLGMRAVRKLRGETETNIVVPGSDLLYGDRHPQLDEAEGRAYTAAVDKAKPYFLTIVHDEDLDQSISLPEGYIRRSSSFSKISSYSYSNPQSGESLQSLEQFEAFQPPPTPVDQCLPTLVQRQHRRVVFDEYCTVIPDIPNYRDFFQCLRDVVTGSSPISPCLASTERDCLGLNFMREAGYVHRDISATNCMWDGSHGKISDLEYAKPYDTIKEHDAITVLRLRLPTHQHAEDNNAGHSRVHAC